MTSLDTTPAIRSDCMSRLRGIPSYHFEPTFAQRVQRALSEFAPDCVALEIPEAALPELLWAVEQWPLPCASISASAVFPFVPGDSILEAARVAAMQGITLKAVDIEFRDSEKSSANHLVDGMKTRDSWTHNGRTAWSSRGMRLLNP